MLRMPFPMEEYKGRLEKVRQKMAQQGVDALVVTKPDNIYYISGYGASVIAASAGQLHALTIPAKGEPRIMTRLVEKSTVAETQWTKEPILYADHEDPFNLLAGTLKESGAATGTIGIEKRFLTVIQMERMRQALPDAKFKDTTGLIESVSTILSKLEIDYVRKAAEITNIGFQRGIEQVKEGVHIYEIVGEIYNAMYKAGQTDLFAGSALGLRTPFVGVWAGPQGGCMHETLTTRRLQEGDLVTIEIWGNYHHYVAVAQGTIYVGNNPPEDIVDNYKMLSSMYSAAKAALKAGVTSGHLYNAANEVYRSRKGEDYFRRVGSSMGLGAASIHLDKGGKDVLVAGYPAFLLMVIAKPACLTCTASVIVTETGCEEITSPLLELTMKK